MRRRAIDAVLFDVGGTLLRVHPSVGHIYADAARRHGVEASPEALNLGFRSAWKKSLARSTARGHRTSDAIQRSEWLDIVRETFGAAVQPEKLAALFEDLFERFASPEPWRIAPGVRASLELLRREGVRLGVLSNWDSRLERMLEVLELRAAFDFFVVSHAVLLEKPHPEIFRRALAEARAPADRVLHVGDSYAADIDPAQRAGIQTLWIAPEAERRQTGYRGLGLDAFPIDPAPLWRQVLSGAIELPNFPLPQPRD